MTQFGSCLAVVRPGHGWPWDLARISTSLASAESLEKGEEKHPSLFKTDEAYAASLGEIFTGSDLKIFFPEPGSAHGVALVQTRCSDSSSGRVEEEVPAEC